MAGWIKLHRQLIDKAIWQTSTTEQKIILITILLLASHKNNEWEWQGKRFTVQPGQFVTSSSKLAEAAGVTRQNVRTALARFEKYEFLTSQSTKTGLLINVVNWGLYQGDAELPNQPSNQELTNDQPTPNQELTTIKNYKKDKNDKNGKNDITTLSGNPTAHVEIITYLNSVCGTRYNPSTKATREHINARLREGYTVADFKTVIDKKVNEWGKRPEMVQYLRPQTLFGTKFESYLNQPYVSGQKLNTTRAGLMEWLNEDEGAGDVVATYEDAPILTGGGIYDEN